MHLTAGTFILELNFEGEVNYDLTISLIPDKAKLNYSKLTITKGFSKQLKADGGKIKSCNSSNQSIASVNNKGKIFAKKMVPLLLVYNLQMDKSFYVELKS